MDSPATTLPLWLDLTAIAIGAVTAAMVAEQFRDKKLDWLGVVIIGITVGLGGGIIRDLLLGIRPVSMETEWFLFTAGASALGGMLLQRLLRRMDGLVSVLDAAALGFFCAVGTLKAMNFELPILPTLLVGTVTAAGGGVVRDMLLGMPVGILFVGSLYAIAATAGSAAFVLADYFGVSQIIGIVICVAVTFAVRMASVWFGLSLPEQIALRMPRFRRSARTGKQEREQPFTDQEILEASGFHALDTRPIAVLEEKRANLEQKRTGDPRPE
ncbi:trimeric intracellular cation channel family protein [Pseudoclavibacter helvolus]|uniref:Putative membrane protein YeiH n=1 Tax=Pseudoclavibacter helvolus TaxID=255205 RepID=A0A7W4UMD7_9MICO|nr:TRIC cation channel family protein [Pseudoclavibacter helvolus]MBB2956833.1 putative membrane protein YeiH [Pseudoclavibacter helvolus]